MSIPELRIKNDDQARQRLEKYFSITGPARYVDDPAGAYNFAGVKNPRLLSMVTGEETHNKTLTRFGLGGCDLGFTANIGNKTYLVFGDTHYDHYIESPQKHNSVIWTTSDDYTKGIVLDGCIMDEADGRFKEIIPCGVSGLESEAATIPGGAFALGNTLYVSYMSVHHWTGTNEWPSNYGSFYKSNDGGQNWQRVVAMTWPGDTSFVQNCPVLLGDMIYVMGTGSARGNPMALMRVPKDQFEVFEAYEYLTGYSADGNPVFEKGREAMYGALHLMQDTGEMSIIWSEYLQEWLCMYKPIGVIQLIAAKHLWGPWSKPVQVINGDQMYAAYGTAMNPRYVSKDGKKIGFFVSQWWPIYNVGMAEVELIRRDEMEEQK